MAVPHVGIRLVELRLLLSEVVVASRGADLLLRLARSSQRGTSSHILGAIFMESAGFRLAKLIMITSREHKIVI